MKKWMCGLAVLLHVGIAGQAAAVVFPNPSATGETTGLKQMVYGVLRDVDDPPISFSEVETAFAGQREFGRFLAANSGGTFGVYFSSVLDVPIELNADRTRPANWMDLAPQYVRDNYGIEPTDLYVQTYNLHNTEPYPDQTWAGFYVPTLNVIALQELYNTGALITHELGHRLDAVHAGDYRSERRDGYFLYRWDDATQDYVVYGEDDVEAAAGNFTAVPYGAKYNVQGNFFDVMGNSNSMGHFRAHQKRDLGWLDPDVHFADLDETGAGTYRLYAHDQLEVISIYNQDQVEVFGVEEGYADVLYGLTFQRTGELFSKDLGEFQADPQTIHIEYRSTLYTADSGGVLFYVDDRLVDVDPDRGAGGVDLELGQTIDDVDIALSLFTVTEAGDDFLSYYPSPPANRYALRDTWYRITVASMGTDSIGDYVELQISVVPEPATMGMVLGAAATLLVGMFVKRATSGRPAANRDG